MKVNKQKLFEAPVRRLLDQKPSKRETLKTGGWPTFTPCKRRKERGTRRVLFFDGLARLYVLEAVRKNRAVR